jgi:hypothetical protein
MFLKIAALDQIIVGFWHHLTYMLRLSLVKPSSPYFIIGHLEASLSVKYTRVLAFLLEVMLEETWRASGLSRFFLRWCRHLEAGAVGSVSFETLFLRRFGAVSFRRVLEPQAWDQGPSCFFLDVLFPHLLYMYNIFFFALFSGPKPGLEPTLVRGRWDNVLVAAHTLSNLVVQRLLGVKPLASFERLAL